MQNRCWESRRDQTSGLSETETIGRGLINLEKRKRPQCSEAHHEHCGARRGLGVRHAVPQRRGDGGPVCGVLGAILLERLVRLRLQVVLQRLQRRLRETVRGLSLRSQRDRRLQYAAATGRDR